MGLPVISFLPTESYALKGIAFIFLQAVFSKFKIKYNEWDKNVPLKCETINKIPRFILTS